MKKIFIIGVIAVIAIIAIFMIINNNQNVLVEIEDPKIRIVTSFYPLAEFSKQVGGERVEVIKITPAGVDPHGFEPSPRSFVDIYSAHIFIFNGMGLDPWAERIAPDLKNRGVSVIKMTEHFNLLKAVDKHDEEEKKEEEKKDKYGEYDPHIWLDPIIAKRQVEIIRDALKEIDKDNAEIYQRNAESYLALLAGLDERYRIGLAVCEIRTIVTSHAAFAYLAKQYNLDMINIAGLSPEQEPSPERMVEIVNLVREKNIRYIFFETLVSPKLAEVIAKEVGIQTLVLNPIEGLTDEELMVGKNYISVMEENLVNLRRALACQ